MKFLYGSTINTGIRLLLTLPCSRKQLWRVHETALVGQLLLLLIASAIASAPYRPFAAMLNFLPMLLLVHIVCSMTLTHPKLNTLAVTIGYLLWFCLALVLPILFDLLDGAVTAMGVSLYNVLGAISIVLMVSAVFVTLSQRRRFLKGDNLC